MANKGPPFERAICKALSLWWSNEEHTDLFWRTAGSGGRATVRGRSSKRTLGGYGDITATSAEGQPLLDVMALEAKCGYSKFSVQDLLDKSERAATQEYQSWIEQAAASQKLSGALGWAVILKRKQRQPLIMLSWDVWQPLLGVTSLPGCPSMEVVWSDGDEVTNDDFGVVAFKDFVKLVEPKDIRALALKHKGGT